MCIYIMTLQYNIHFLLNLYRKLHGSGSINDKSHACL